MKKFTLALTLMALLPSVSVAAYEYAQPERRYYTRRPVTQTGTARKTNSVRRTNTYNGSASNASSYNRQPARYQTVTVDEEVVEYDNGGYRNSSYDDSGYATRNKKETRTVKKSYSSQERKFFLAHPFFQPLQGKVGSVTDFSYAKSNFGFNLLNGATLDFDPASPTYENVTPVGLVGLDGDAEITQFAVKEDLSYGLTDTLALVLMAQYDKTKTTFKLAGEEDDKSGSGLNLFGIGLQNRFVDNNEWIVMGEAFFEHQNDVANTFMLGLKAGYKVERTTIYGIGRFAYSNLIDGDIYGAYADDSEGDWLMLSYKTDVKNLFQAEGGLGVFAVLNKYFTLNGELTYGYYDWHNQLNIKGALGWQPADNFALNLYAATALYDSGKDKIRRYMNNDVNPTEYPLVEKSPDVWEHVFTDSKLLYTEGEYKMKDYKEWKIGVQAILYF